MDAVLTVKQPYADRIMEGTKRYEFRRKAPARDIDGLYVHIAGTGPYAQAYVGVNCVHTGTPEAIWEYCSECAAIMPPGISREDFFAYFDGCETATAISLAPRPQVLNPPIQLETCGQTWDAAEVLSLVPFVDRVVFGRWNYGPKVTAEDREWYLRQAEAVRKWCKRWGAECHIKKGTE